MAEKEEYRNWADEIGRKVWVSYPTGLVRRDHTSGVIKKLSKTLIFVETKEGKTFRFNRFGQIASHPYRDQYGKGVGGNRAMMSKNNYMGMED